MYRSSPLRSALNMCASAKECHHPHPIPPHPIPCDVCAGECGWKEWCKIFSGVYLWLQSVCAGDSGKWLCAHVTPVCVRRWLWVEKMMQNCACVYLWLQSVCAGDPLTFPGVMSVSGRVNLQNSNPNFAAKAMYGHSEIVQLLLSKGAQVNTNGDGETAIDLAYRYPETWIYLLDLYFLFMLFP